MTDFTTALTDAQAYTAYSYAQNTRQAYASDWHRFTIWCATHQRRALPATPETILGYIGTLVDQVQVATIDRRLCGIAFYHRQARQPDPTDDPEVATVLRGIRRKQGTAPIGKVPITVDLLRTLVAACGENYRGIQERALLLLGFAGAFRRSELVAVRVDDLTFVPEGLIVRVRRSKTDQIGLGTAKGIPYGANLATCPVRAVRAWLKIAGLRSGQVFRALTPHGHATSRPLPAYAVGRIIQRAIRHQGLDATRYGGHSLRAGFVTAAARAGVAERLIMEQTGHTDVRTLRRYIRDGALFRENAAAQIGL
ncbi:MAG: site-specific integrase [Roseiflexaceae bacterium]|nr:site-specific integrase [Roseiflexaceae bacterium]